MDLESLKNQPELQNISNDKLDFLLQFAKEPLPKNTREMSNKFLEAMQHAKQENIQFTQPETNLLIEILKSQLSEEDRRKADRLIHLVHAMQKR